MKFPAPAFLLATLVILSTPQVARSQIVAIGDSNVAGKGVSSSENYPAKLERALRAKGYTGIVVINAGINGDTTQGVLRRLNTDVPPSTKVAIVWVGINDVMKHGIPREAVAANKTEIANRLRSRGIEVVMIHPQLSGLRENPKYVLTDKERHFNSAGYDAVVTRTLPEVEAAFSAASRK